MEDETMARQREDAKKTATATLNCESEERRHMTLSLLLSLGGCKHPESIKTVKQQQQLVEMREELPPKDNDKQTSRQQELIFLTDEIPTSHHGGQVNSFGGCESAAVDVTETFHTWNSTWKSNPL